MSWFKLDDNFPGNPKVMRAGPDAAWLYICGGCYCAKHLTDGLIPKVAVPTLTTLRAHARLAAVLVREGLWHDLGTDFEIHDYLQFNPSRDEVENVRRQARERRSNAGKRSRERTANGINPDPTPPDVPTEQSGARKRATAPPKDFQPTDEHRKYAGDHGLDLDGEVVRWLTDCEAKGRTYRVVNAGFTTWLHKAVDFGRGGKQNGKPVATLEQLAQPRRVLDDERPACPLGQCNGSGWLDTEDPGVVRECPHLEVSV